MELPKIDFNPPSYFCRRATRPFDLDGNIFKDFWADAPFTDLFMDIEGPNHTKPRFETRAKMLWDDENLYFGAVLYGDEIWATLTERDCVIFYDNDFEIFIDPDSDTHGYFEYEMNALNTVWDLFLTKPYRDSMGKPLNGWDIQGLRSAVHIEGNLNDPSAENKYWSVEVVMPFKALTEMSGTGQLPSIGDYYRLNFSRVQWPVTIEGNTYIKAGNVEDNWVWAPTGLVNIHYPEMWGFLFFTENGESYEIPEVEDLKWQLRQVYYQQHNFYEQHQQFADSPEALGLPGMALTVDMMVTRKCFEVSVLTADRRKRVTLFNDGLVQVTDLASLEASWRHVPKNVAAKVSPDTFEVLESMYSSMPYSDLLDYDADLFVAFAEHAVKTRRTMPWGRDISDEDFMEFVVPARVNNEDLEFYSAAFFEEIEPRITGMKRSEAALEINYWCLEKAAYRSTDFRTTSPLTTVRRAYGRCGEESTLAVAAFRSVGIPARQCYVPRWSHCDDNHAWIEIQTEEGWQYLGACEPEPVLNRGWFSEPASRAMMIHYRSGEERKNILSHYSETKFLTVIVKDEQNLPVDDATVRFEVVNFSEFYPIYTAQSDAEGRVSLETGMGDLFLFAHKDGRFGYSKVTAETEGEIAVVLKTSEKQALPEGSYTIYAPKSTYKEEEPGSDQAVALHEKKVAAANEKRGSYENNFPDTDSEVIKEARGNHPVIEAFLNEKNDSRRALKQRFLESFAPKDLVDIHLDVMEEHFGLSLQYRDLYDEDLFVEYVMNPKIHYEKIRLYRGTLTALLTDAEKKDIRRNPGMILKWAENAVGSFQVLENHRFLMSPATVAMKRMANSVSFNIFLVAMLRTLGIPSEYKADEGVLAYRLEGQWCQIHLNGVAVDPRGTLKLTKGASAWMEYRKTFTLGKLNGCIYDTLDLDELTWDDDSWVAELEEGSYRIVVGTRDTDGNNHVWIQPFDITEGTVTEVKVQVPKVVTEDRRIVIDHPEIHEDLAVCWLQPGEEPTEHLLNELLELAGDFKKLQKQMKFYVKDEGAMTNPLLTRVRERFSDIPLDVGFETSLTPVYEGLEIKNQQLPLVVVNKGGSVTGGWSGYQVGIGQQLLMSLLG